MISLNWEKARRVSSSSHLVSADYTFATFFTHNFKHSSLWLANQCINFWPFNFQKIQILKTFKLQILKLLSYLNRWIIETSKYIQLQHFGEKKVGFFEMRLFSGLIFQELVHHSMNASTDHMTPLNILGGHFEKTQIIADIIMVGGRYEIRVLLFYIIHT